MSQGDEGLPISPPVLEHLTLDLGIPAGIVVLVAKSTHDLSGGVPLLERGVLIIGQNLIDDRLNRAKDGSRSLPGPRSRRLGIGEDVPDGLSGMSKLSGDLSDRVTITTSPSNRTIVVHRKHVLGLRVGESIPVGTFTLTKATAVGSLDDHLALRWAPRSRSLPDGIRRVDDPPREPRRSLHETSTSQDTPTDSLGR